MDTIMFDNWEDYVSNADTAVEAECRSVMNDESFVIYVRRYLPLEHRLSFVKSVADMCIVGNEYHPAIKNIAYNYYRILYYTNIECGDDMNKIISLIYDTNICSVMDSIIVDDLSVAVNEELSLRTNHLNASFKKIADLLNTLDDALTSSPDALKSIFDIADKTVGDK